MPIPGLGLFTGGGGVSASSSATGESGPALSGSKGNVSFGGINTGRMSTAPAWIYPVALAAAAAFAFFYFRKR